MNWKAEKTLALIRVNSLLFLEFNLKKYSEIQSFIIESYPSIIFISDKNWK